MLYEDVRSQTDRLVQDICANNAGPFLDAVYYF